MAIGRRKRLQHHWGLDHIEHRLSHMRDEEWVQEDRWYLTSLSLRSRLGGNPTAPGASTSFCSIREMASRTAEDQARQALSRDDEGGLPSPGAAMPRLPYNPSKRPRKKLLSRGLSAAMPTRMSGTTSGCLRGSLCSNWHTLPR